jgi:MFS family permease
MSGGVVTDHTAETGSAVRSRRRHALEATLGLGVSQMIGWGTTFSPLALYAKPIQAELGLSREAVFSGIAIMLVVNAALSPRMGRMVDRRGARAFMMWGSVAIAGALIVLSQAQGYASWALAWALIGAAMTLMLTTTALPALVQAVGNDARRAITGLTLVTGFTSTVFLPLNHLLFQSYGWRGAFLVHAAMHLLICLPIHWRVLRPRPNTLADTITTRTAATPATAPPNLLTTQQRRLAFILIAVWSCMEGLLTWGLYMQVIDIFGGFGIATGTAIAIWALNGPSQAGARAVELAFGSRYSILATALGSAVFVTLGFIVLAFAGVTTTTAAILAIMIGLGHGLFAIARNTLPLVVFGAREYGAYMGLLTVPQNAANAIAPLLFAAAYSQYGASAALTVAGAAASCAFLSVVALVTFCWRAGIGRHAG